MKERSCIFDVVDKCLSITIYDISKQILVISSKEGFIDKRKFKAGYIDRNHCG